MIAKHCWVLTSLRMHKQHGHKEDTAAVLCDVSGYAEVCLPSSCLETGCIIRCVYYLATAVSVAQTFLHGANMPQYA
jgi:hypothetical protein